MYKIIFTLCLIISFELTCGQLVQNDAENKTDLSSTTLNSETTTFKPPSNISCEGHDNDCKGCVENSECYYCSTTDKCHKHIGRVIVEGQCKMKKAFFLTCKTNFEVLLIIVCVLSAIPLLIILIVCCYCCCKKKGFKLSKDDIKWARQREERKQLAAERRKERAERTEEIRKKYGLVKDSNPYQKFDA